MKKQQLIEYMENLKTWFESKAQTEENPTVKTYCNGRAASYTDVIQVLEEDDEQQ